MNQYTELLTYIKQLGDADVFINTVTQGDVDQIDWNKGNILPLLHVSIDEARFTNGKTVIFTVSLACLQQRDDNRNEIVSDKFWLQDNEVDNHNETLASLNRIWTQMFRDFDENNYTASENPSLTKISYDKTNILDGWELIFDVELPNTTLCLTAL